MLQRRLRNLLKETEMAPSVSVEPRTDGFSKGLAAEDFDGDNHKDIITASSSLPYQSWLYEGVGDGSFLPTVHYPTSGGV
ncbi:MAG: VCBS repeat-containing protein [Flavobacteriales bacterium]|nr:VCBS repeat-containing protein [Flavobacteriales bacterium]